jgi:hypothetical protein
MKRRIFGPRRNEATGEWKTSTFLKTENAICMTYL